jgi:hypothetical protein
MEEYYGIKFNEDNLVELPLKDIQECIICFNDIKTEYELCSLSCGHTFHADCMYKYERKTPNYTCPLCRTNLNRSIYISDEAYKVYKKSKTDKSVFNNWMDAAKQGDAVAACNLGILYLEGDGCEKNHIQSMKWFCISAYKNVSNAQYNLGIYFNKYFIDYPKSIYWFKKASENNNLESTYILGVLYYQGSIIERNYDEAIKYYKIAADKGHGLAQYNLSMMYLDEPYKNIQLHVHYLFLASIKTVPQAINNLAYYFENGLNEDNCVIQTDIDMAIKLYRVASNMGFEFSQYALAIIYNTYYVESFPEFYIPYVVRMLLNAADKNHEDAIYWLDHMNFSSQLFYDR